MKIMLFQITNHAILMILVLGLSAIGFFILGLIKIRQYIYNRYNIFMALFYLLLGLSFTLNVIYIVFPGSITFKTRIFLSRLVFSLILFSLSFPNFVLIGVNRSFKVIPSIGYIVYFLLNYVLTIPVFFMGDVVFSSNNDAVYTHDVSIYGVIYSSVQIVFFLVESVIILRMMNEKKVRVKFYLFILGYILSALFMIFAILGNAEIISSNLVILTYFICILPGAYLLFRLNLSNNTS